MPLVAKPTKLARPSIQEAVQKAYNEPMYRVFENPVAGCWQLGTMTQIKSRKKFRRINGILQYDRTQKWAIVPTPLTFPREMSDGSAQSFVDYMKKHWVYCHNEEEAAALVAEAEAKEDAQARIDRQKEADLAVDHEKDIARSSPFDPNFWAITPDKKKMHKRVDKTLDRLGRYIDTGNSDIISEELADNSEGSMIHWDPN